MKLFMFCNKLSQIVLNIRTIIISTVDNDNNDDDDYDINHYLPISLSPYLPIPLSFYPPISISPYLPISLFPYLPISIILVYWCPHQQRFMGMFLDLERYNIGLFFMKKWVGYGYDFLHFL